MVTKSKESLGGDDKDVAQKARRSKKKAVEHPHETHKQYRKDTQSQKQRLGANIHKNRQIIKQGSG